jgi:hypothetical protein
MTVIPFLQYRAFRPDDIEAMTSALEEVCKALDLAEDAKTERELVANQITALAHQGERSAEDLRDRVLREFRHEDVGVKRARARVSHLPSYGWPRQWPRDHCGMRGRPRGHSSGAELDEWWGLRAMGRRASCCSVTRNAVVRRRRWGTIEAAREGRENVGGRWPQAQSERLRPINIGGPE